MPKFEENTLRFASERFDLRLDPPWRSKTPCTIIQRPFTTIRQIFQTSHLANAGGTYAHKISLCGVFAEHIRLPFRPFEWSMSRQTTFLGLFTAFLFPPPSLSLLSAPCPLFFPSHFASARNSVENASAVFFPSLKNCVIEAKWVGKPFGLVSCDFAKKLQKVIEDCLVKMTRRMSVLRDRKGRFEKAWRKRFSNMSASLIYFPNYFNSNISIFKYLMIFPCWTNVSFHLISSKCFLCPIFKSVTPFDLLWRFGKV